MSFGQKLSSLFFCFLWLTPYFAHGESGVFECGVNANPGSNIAPAIGVAKAVVIYATWDSTAHPKKDTLPDWWAKVWNPDSQHSVTAAENA